MKFETFIYHGVRLFVYIFPRHMVNDNDNDDNIILLLFFFLIFWVGGVMVNKVGATQVQFPVC